MNKYIDAEKLKAEIEFTKSVYDNPKRVIHGVADAFRQDGRAAMCDDILKKIKMEVDRKGHEKSYADLLEERDTYKELYNKKVDEIIRLEEDKSKAYWHNVDVKNALTEIIKQYRPDFKLYDIENEIYNKRRNK